MTIAGGMLAAGVPARVIRPVSGAAKEWVDTNPALYQERRHAASVRPAGELGSAR